MEYGRDDIERKRCVAINYMVTHLFVLSQRFRHLKKEESKQAKY
jgi:hypothetical protein